eukprot:IDg19420t1
MLARTPCQDSTQPFPHSNFSDLLACSDHQSWQLKSGIGDVGGSLRAMRALVGLRNGDSTMSRSVRRLGRDSCGSIRDSGGSVKDNGGSLGEVRVRLAYMKVMQRCRAAPVVLKS